MQIKAAFTSLLLISSFIFEPSVSSTEESLSMRLYAQSPNSAPLEEQSPPPSDGFIELPQSDGSKRLVPVITGEIFSLIILTAMYGAVLLLVVTLGLAFFAARNLNNGDRNQFLSEALPNAIEGITIIYIVVAVVLFGILGITSAEGSLSILSAISGYVLGKSQGKKSSEPTSRSELNENDIDRR